jgi:8-oxo-dGTP pyrophosphatase MutT (NUDIX family)
MGAAREAWEETGIDPEHIQLKMQFTDDMAIGATTH